MHVRLQLSIKYQCINPKEKNTTHAQLLLSLAPASSLCLTLMRHPKLCVHDTISHLETGKSCSTARKPPVPSSLLSQTVPDGPFCGSQAPQSPQHQAPHMKSQHRTALWSHWTVTVACRFAPRPVAACTVPSLGCTAWFLV